MCKETFLTVRKERTVPHVGFFWRTVGLVLCLQTAITQHYKNDTFWVVEQINLVILTVLKLEYKSLRAEVTYKIYLLLKTSVFPKTSPQESNSLLIYFRTLMRVNLNENVSVQVKLC